MIKRLPYSIAWFISCVIIKVVKSWLSTILVNSTTISLVFDRCCGMFVQKQELWSNQLPWPRPKLDVAHQTNIGYLPWDDSLNRYSVPLQGLREQFAMIFPNSPAQTNEISDVGQSPYFLQWSNGEAVPILGSGRHAQYLSARLNTRIFNGVTF